MQQSGFGSRQNVGEGRGGALTPSLVPKEVKLEKPSVYTGKKSELNNFLFEMRQYIDSVGLGSNGSACRFLVSHLKGDALTWWRSFSKDSLNIFSTLTLDVLIDELKEQFSDIDKEMKLRERLLSLKQTSSVQAFASEFKRLQLELGSNRLDDDFSLHVFLVGLKPATRQAVMLQRPDTFEEASLLAERADQAFFWNRGLGSSGTRRAFYKGSGSGKASGGVSQYSNSRYKGPAPMVLGNVEKSGLAEVVCYHCGKKGHYKRDCWALQRGQSGQNKQQSFKAKGKQPMKKLNVVQEVQADQKPKN